MGPENSSSSSGETIQDETEEGGKQTACPSCGSPMREGEQYCPRCGRRIPAIAETTEEKRSLKRSLLLFARDIVVAVLIVAIVLGSIFAYTRVWPPMVVIESASMQHDDHVSHIGVIDTGDLVLVQLATQRSDVITWVEGKASGYMTYSNYGDVIIFHKPLMETPIIHRPIFYLEYNPSNSTFDIPELGRLPIDVMWGGTNSGGAPVRSPIGLNGVVWIAQSGWTGDINFTFNVGSFLRFHYSGYVTMGDNNANKAAHGIPRHADAGYDADFLVSQSAIVGKARGELPWFGLIKLTLYPSPGACCTGWGDTVNAPANSWSSLLYSIILIILIPILFDVLTILIGRWRKGRKMQERKGDSVESEAPSSEPPEPEEKNAETETGAAKDEPPPKSA